MDGFLEHIDNNRLLDGRILRSLKAATYRCRYTSAWSDIYASSEIEMLTGYAAEDFKNGKINFLDLFFPNEVESVVQSYRDQMREHGAYVVNAKIMTQDGDVRWIRDTGVKSGRDEWGWFIDGVMLDITGQKSSEIERDRAVRRAEKHARFSERALDVIAHELRTPLNAVYGFSQLLRDGAGEFPRELLAEYAMNIVDASEQLQALSDSALKSLTIQELTSKDRKPFSVLKAIEKARKRQKKAAGKSKLTTKCVCDNSALSRSVIYGVKDLFHEIIQELFFNATMHNDEAVTIEVTAHIMPDEALAISFDDDGKGVNSKELPEIFAAFRKQVDDENLKTRGFGLGLNRVLVAAETMGAQVHAGRSPRGGLRVVLVFPAEFVMEGPTPSGEFDLSGYRRMA